MNTVLTPGPILITGGASGIGARLAAAFAADNTVVVLDRNVPEPAHQVPNVRYLTADITDPGDLARVAADLADVAPLGGIVHCAAIAHFGSFAETSVETWQQVLNVNLHGTFLVVQTLMPLIADHGRIVLFSSGTVFRGPGETAVYAASKAGVIGFGRGLAAELGPRNITVNMVAPGLVVTPMSESIAHTEVINIASRPIARAATTDDFVEPVSFLLSPGASFITGQTIVVDGGSVRH